MKTKCLYTAIVSVFVLFSCATNKSVITENELSGNKVLIVGLVEYDYSQLENKSIKGINVFLDSKENHSMFELPNTRLQNNDIVRQKFISLIGSYGSYQLVNVQNVSTTETDNFLALMNNYRNNDRYSNIILQDYSILDGKIINIGKIIVKYQGGQITDGKIAYTYSIATDNSNTQALEVLKESNPLVYSKFSENIYSFNNQ